MLFTVICRLYLDAGRWNCPLHMMRFSIVFVALRSSDPDDLCYPSENDSIYLFLTMRCQFNKCSIKFQSLICTNPAQGSKAQTYGMPLQGFSVKFDDFFSEA